MLKNLTILTRTDSLGIWVCSKGDHPFYSSSLPGKNIIFSFLDAKLSSVTYFHCAIFSSIPSQLVSRWWWFGNIPQTSTEYNYSFLLSQIEIEKFSRSASHRQNSIFWRHLKTLLASLVNVICLFLEVIFCHFLSSAVPIDLNVILFSLDKVLK